jgi:hypothetical protein
MNGTMYSRNPWTTVMMMLLAVLVLLVVALASLMQPDVTTGAGGPGGRAVHAERAGGTGGPVSYEDPNLDRHAEIVTRFQKDEPR